MPSPPAVASPGAGAAAGGPPGRSPPRRTAPPLPGPGPTLLTPSPCRNSSPALPIRPIGVGGQSSSATEADGTGQLRPSPSKFAGRSPPAESITLQHVRRLQSAVAAMPYTTRGPTYNIDKSRPLEALLQTGRSIRHGKRPIQCVEAVLLALALSQGMADIERFGISFRAVDVLSGKVNRHLVLGLYAGGRYGAIGRSREPGLMNKPLAFPTLVDLLADFREAWREGHHTLQTVTLSRPVPHSHLTYPVHWEYMCLDVSNWQNAAQFITQFAAILEVPVPRPASMRNAWDHLAEQAQADPFQRQKRLEREALRKATEGAEEADISLLAGALPAPGAEAAEERPPGDDGLLPGPGSDATAIGSPSISLSPTWEDGQSDAVDGPARSKPERGPELPPILRYPVVVSVSSPPPAYGVEVPAEGLVLDGSPAQAPVTESPTSPPSADPGMTAPGTVEVLSPKVSPVEVPAALAPDTVADLYAAVCVASDEGGTPTEAVVVASPTDAASGEESAASPCEASGLPEPALGSEGEDPSAPATEDATPTADGAASSPAAAKGPHSAGVLFAGKGGGAPKRLKGNAKSQRSSTAPPQQLRSDGENKSPKPLPLNPLCSPKTGLSRLLITPQPRRRLRGTSAPAPAHRGTGAQPSPAKSNVAEGDAARPDPGGPRTSPTPPPALPAAPGLGPDGSSPVDPAPEDSCLTSERNPNGGHPPAPATPDRPPEAPASPAVTFVLAEPPKPPPGPPTSPPAGTEAAKGPGPKSSGRCPKRRDSPPPYRPEWRAKASLVAAYAAVARALGGGRARRSASTPPPASRQPSPGLGCLARVIASLPCVPQRGGGALVSHSPPARSLYRTWSPEAARSRSPFPGKGTVATPKHALGKPARCGGDVLDITSIATVSLTPTAPFPELATLSRRGPVGGPDVPRPIAAAAQPSHVRQVTLEL